MYSKDTQPKRSKIPLKEIFFAFFLSFTPAKSDAINVAEQENRPISGGSSVMLMSPELLEIVTQEDISLLIERMNGVIDDVIQKLEPEGNISPRADSNYFDANAPSINNFGPLTRLVENNLVSVEKAMEWERAFFDYQDALTDLANLAFRTQDLASISTLSMSENGSNVSIPEARAVIDAYRAVVEKQGDVSRQYSIFLGLTREIADGLEQDA